MTTSQWIIYYAAELMVLVPGLSAEEAMRLAARALEGGITEHPEIAARETYCGGLRPLS